MQLDGDRALSVAPAAMTTKLVLIVMGARRGTRPDAYAGIVIDVRVLLLRADLRCGSSSERATIGQRNQEW